MGLALRNRVICKPFGIIIIVLAFNALGNAKKTAEEGRKVLIFGQNAQKC